MTSYQYADDVAPLLPKGTILKVTAWHDNTIAKKSNPDPNQWVGWGDRTVDEMAHAWINIVYMNDADYKAEVEARTREDRDDSSSSNSSSRRSTLGNIPAGAPSRAPAFVRCSGFGSGLLACRLLLTPGQFRLLTC